MQILDSGAFKSINNHLLNCFERNNTIIVDTSPATDMYLDNYFARNLADDDRKWDTIMMPAQRFVSLLHGPVASNHQLHCSAITPPVLPNRQYY